MGADRTPDRGAIAGASQPRTEADRRAAARALGAHYARLRDLNTSLARGRDSGPFAELPRVPYDTSNPFELIDGLVPIGRTHLADAILGTYGINPCPPRAG